MNLLLRSFSPCSCRFGTNRKNSFESKREVAGEEGRGRWGRRRRWSEQRTCMVLCLRWDVWHVWHLAIPLASIKQYKVAGTHPDEWRNQRENESIRELLESKISETTSTQKLGKVQTKNSSRSGAVHCGQFWWKKVDFCSFQHFPEIKRSASTANVGVVEKLHGMYLGFHFGDRQQPKRLSIQTHKLAGKAVTRKCKQTVLWEEDIEMKSSNNNNSNNSQKYENQYWKVEHLAKPSCKNCGQCKGQSHGTH